MRDGIDGPFVRAGRPVLAADVGGVRIRGHLRHRSFLAEAAREGTTYRELFVRSLRPGLTVVDGGAHVGVYSVLASHAVGASGRVVAFEPDPYNYSALAANVRRLGRGNVELHRQALADRPGVSQFHVSRGTIGSSLVRRGDTARVTSVAVTTVDAVLAGRELGGLLVKLNVESAEPLVLAGMGETLARVEEATMFVELDPLGLRKAGVDPAAFVQRIQEHGFQVSTIHLRDQTLRPPDLAAKGHLFCVRGRTS